MQIGISTASLFGRFLTEDGLEFLSRNKVKTCEVFLESFCEYNKKFGSLLKGIKGDTEVHSIHTLTTQIEPQLYSLNERAQKDSFDLLEGVLECGEETGAKYYTFHGGARFKKTPMVLDFDRIGKITQQIIDRCALHGISLAYENVHWGYYNYIGFFKELKNRTSGLKGTLDIKQARQSGIDFREYLKEMGSDIATVHVSDLDKNGKMCLPTFGEFDFYELFSGLEKYNFDGCVLIESYKNDYENLDQLLESYGNLQIIKEKVFGK